MPSQWKEVVRLAFKGQRFHDHALDLVAIGELGQFQKLIAETAKVLWRAAHPDKQRLPKGFQEQTRLCLRKIEAGSVVAPLEVFIEEPEQGELFEPGPTAIEEAIALARDVFRAAETDQPLPERFPQSLVSEYQRWGQVLEQDEAIEVITPGRQPARVTPLSRSRLAAFADASHEDHVDITGEVLEADVRQERFQIWSDERTGATVTFSPEQETEVTNALRDHLTVRLRVIGRGEFSARGELLRITQVDQLQTQRVGEVPYDATARPIEDVLTELAAEIPQEDWNRLPPDLTDNLDHHLYGTPKQ